jgi:arylsulfatase A-like enzyme
VHTDQQLRELIANYYGMISLIDHNVGRIVCELERLNVLQDTLVVYSTDHGDWLGDHGLILKGPMAYEGLLRVGLLFQGPGVPKGKVVQDPVSTLDLPATFADFAGVAFGKRTLCELEESHSKGRHTRFRVQRMGFARFSLRRRSRPAHGAHQGP